VHNLMDPDREPARPALPLFEDPRISDDI
jgi:hypothetical protein